MRRADCGGALHPSFMVRMALLEGVSDGIPGLSALLGCRALCLTWSSDQKSFEMRPRSSRDSYDRNIAFTELLTYTIERHDVVLPLGDFAMRTAKNAPSILIGERFAAVRLRRTGRKSSRENPWARKSSSDHKLD